MNTTSAETSPEPTVIKKYANRRLYNTATSSYVTLDTLCQMVKEGTEFVVYDAKTGGNITKPVLTQIIFEEEAKGQNLLPASFLRQLIRFYGDSLEAVLPNYLEMSMEAFTRNQEQFRHYMADAFTGMGMSPFKKLDEISKQNMVMFQRALELFNPFAASEMLAGNASPEQEEQPRKPAEGAADMEELRAQLDMLQRRFDRMVGDRANRGSAAADPRQDAPGPGAATGGPAAADARKDVPGSSRKGG